MLSKAPRINAINLPGTSGHINLNDWKEAVEHLKALQTLEPQDILTINIGDISLRFLENSVEIDFATVVSWRSVPLFSELDGAARLGSPELAERQDRGLDLPGGGRFGVFHCNAQDPNQVLRRLQQFCQHPGAGPLVIATSKGTIYVWKSEHGIGYTVDPAP